MTREQARAQAQAALSHLPAAQSEALALLLAVEGIDQVEFMMRPKTPLADPQRWQQVLSRRCAGESVAAISGRADFFNLTLAVGPGVLIPRPDTESFADVEWGVGPVLDLGTGSGALACWAYAQGHRPVLALERSLMALSYARRNVPLGVTLVRGDWSRSVAPRSIGTVLANPPYIADDEPELAGDGVAHEPRSALVAQQSGYADLLHIAQDGSRILRDRGWLWLEHGYQQHSKVAEHLTDLGYQQVRGIKDLAGHTRITGGQWNG